MSTPISPLEMKRSMLSQITLENREDERDLQKAKTSLTKTPNLAKIIAVYSNLPTGFIRIKQR